MLKLATVALFALPLLAQAQGNIECHGRIAVQSGNEILVTGLKMEVHELTGSSEKFFLSMMMTKDESARTGIASAVKSDPKHANMHELNLPLGADYGDLKIHLFDAKSDSPDPAAQAFTISLDQVKQGKKIASANGIVDCTNLGN